MKDRTPRVVGAPQVRWNEIHRRLDALGEISERGWTPSPEQCQSILRQRARILADEAEPSGRSGETIEVVEFLLAQEHYAVESVYVREVCPLRHITPIPCTPAFVLGIINIRGQILSIVDLKQFFNLPDMGLGELNKVIILSNENMEFGVLADRILEIRSIPLAEIQPAPAKLSGIGTDYLRGIARERLVVLAAETLLNDPNLIVGG